MHILARQLVLPLSLFLALLAGSVPLDGGDSCCEPEPSAAVPPPARGTVSEASAKCVGSASCRVCTNCRNCGHCKGGGSCGVCRPARATPPPVTRPPQTPPPRTTPPLTPPERRSPPPTTAPAPIPNPPAAHASRAGLEWTLRSKHLLHGVPVPTDDRFAIQQGGERVGGLSVLVREGFVVGHYDRYKVPAWVSYRWTEENYRQSEAVTGRPVSFKEDHELPPYARAGTDYEHATSGMQRGHMHRDADADAWGDDNVESAALMSNIVPQSGELNPDEWLELEEEHRRVVANPASGIKAVWIICGPVFGPEPKRIGNGVGVPEATYKLIAWFDGGGRMHVRAYVMPQNAEGRLESMLTSVDIVEAMTGLDFFPELEDDVEGPLEAATAISLW